MQSFSSGIYTASQVQNEFLQPISEERWLWDHLNPSGIYQQDLSDFVEMGTGQIDYDATRDVKRTVKFRMRGDGPTLSLSDLVRVRYQRRMLTVDGGWAEWWLGVFTI